MHLYEAANHILSAHRWCTRAVERSPETGSSVSRALYGPVQVSARKTSPSSDRHHISLSLAVLAAALPVHLCDRRHRSVRFKARTCRRFFVNTSQEQRTLSSEQRLEAPEHLDRSGAGGDVFALPVEIPQSSLTYLVELLEGPLVDNGLVSSKSAAQELSYSFLMEACAVIWPLLERPAKGGLLDGLVDLRAASQVFGKKASSLRLRRRRLHQGLLNLTRYLLDDVRERLTPLVALSAQPKGAGNASEASMAAFVKDSLAEKLRLRLLSRDFGRLHEQFMQRSSRRSDFLAAYRDSARENMRKRWNIAFHEWCAETFNFYYLMDAERRERWVHGTQKERSRTTLLHHATRNVQRRLDDSVDADDWKCWSDYYSTCLPPPGQSLRLLDVGSCSNYFGTEWSHCFDVTALDIAPAEDSVYESDFLELNVGDAETSPVVREGDLGAKALESLPARSFDVAVMALMLSFVTSPEDRFEAVAKVRQLLPANDRGLLIIADTWAAVGRFFGQNSRPPWADAVEAAGFKLLPDPQLRWTQEKLPTGQRSRAACYTFATVPLEEVQPPAEGSGRPQLRLLFDDEKKVKRGHGQQVPRRSSPQRDRRSRERSRRRPPQAARRE
eukprot:TRINITY_DN32480_c0_g1_i1.p1 TRINITY_DN32480_c0_g1~~TRINITY_DN32480_c0_g1_i1.p1  ORF type:complete len:614 (+),score=96.78 TRINITY_DN32480_c0_g1_i1:71-1912(+)